MKKVTQAQAIQAMTEWKAAQAEHLQLTNKKMQQQAKLDEKFASPLMVQENKLLATSEVLKRYARENRDELFNGSKTAVVGSGKIKLRISRKLAALPGFDADKVLAKVKKLLPEFIKTKEAVDMSGIKTWYGHQSGAKLLKRCGLFLEETENVSFE